MGGPAAPVSTRGSRRSSGPSERAAEGPSAALGGVSRLTASGSTSAGGHPWIERPPGHRPVPEMARRLREVSVLFVVGACRGGSQPLRLVLYLSGDLLEFRLELAPMVGTEEQLTTAEEDDAQICLGAATVAAVSGRQRARGGQNSSHVASSLARRAVVPGSTSNQAENVPARGSSSKNLSESAVCCRLAANEPYCVSSCLTGSRSVRFSPHRLACRLFLRTCPEPKWFMPGRERDMYFTPTRDRTSMRRWSSLSFGRGWRYNGSTRPRYPRSGDRSRALTQKGHI